MCKFVVRQIASGTSTWLHTHNYMHYMHVTTVLLTCRCMCCILCIGTPRTEEEQPTAQTTSGTLGHKKVKGHTQ